MAAANSNGQGIALMCAAMAAFAINDTIIKLVTDILTVPQIMLLRGVFVCAFMLIWLAATGNSRTLVHLGNRHVLLRSALEAVAGITYFAALARMQIAELTSVLLMAPLLIATGGALFYNEKMRLGGWSAIIVGFLGMLMIVQPGTENFSNSMLLAIISALAIAARDLLTRKIKTEVSSFVVCLAGGAGITLLGLIITAGEWVQSPLTLSLLGSWTLWLALSFAAFVVTLGNYGVILAFRWSSASVVSPFRYSSLLWTMAAGLIIWRQIPNALALAGAVITIACGLYLLQVERKTRRKKQSERIEAARVGIPETI